MADQISQGKFNPDDIEYRRLSKVDLDEVKNLHSEWFPIKYPSNYFNRITQD